MLFLSLGISQGIHVCHLNYLVVNAFAGGADVVELGIYAAVGVSGV